jgi:hypothetical protein
MSDNLLPCPFCGQPGVIEKGLARCSNKGCCNASDATFHIEEWNTRPAQDSTGKVLLDAETVEKVYEGGGDSLPPRRAQPEGERNGMSDSRPRCSKCGSHVYQFLYGDGICSTCHNAPQQVDVGDEVRACAAAILNPHYEALGKSYIEDLERAATYIRQSIQRAVSAKEVELERAKEARNRAGVEERRKYLPKITELSAENDKLKAELDALRKDKAIVDWLIKQGPPGAAEGAGLNDEAWDIAYAHVSDEKRTDAVVMREAITEAMKEGT